MKREASNVGLAGRRSTRNTDGDGNPNIVEYYLGTDPVAGDHATRVATDSFGRPYFAFQARAEHPGVAGGVEWRTNLCSGVWTRSGIETCADDRRSPSNGIVYLKAVFTNAAPRAAFFRIVVDEEPD